MIGVIVTALAATVSLVATGSERHAGGAAALADADILTNVRLIGLTPTTRPYRRGPFYVVHAVDLSGTALRVVADAELGDILSITRLFAPRFDAGPRIIHVPQPGEGADDHDETASPETFDAPPRRLPHRPVRRSERQPLPPLRHNVLSVPPPRAQDLSPIHPAREFVDQFDARAEKFRAPDEQADRLPPLPPGAAPPVPSKQD
jgi:hypothetical protein